MAPLPLAPAFEARVRASEFDRRLNDLFRAFGRCSPRAPWLGAHARGSSSTSTSTRSDRLAPGHDRSARPPSHTDDRSSHDPPPALPRRRCVEMRGSRTLMTGHRDVHSCKWLRAHTSRHKSSLSSRIYRCVARTRARQLSKCPRMRVWLDPIEGRHPIGPAPEQPVSRHLSPRRQGRHTDALCACRVPTRRVLIRGGVNRHAPARNRHPNG
jgi:hypothetical protein